MRCSRSARRGGGGGEWRWSRAAAVLGRRGRLVLFRDQQQAKEGTTHAPPSPSPSPSHTHARPTPPTPFARRSPSVSLGGSASAQQPPPPRPSPSPPIGRCTSSTTTAPPTIRPAFGAVRESLRPLSRRRRRSPARHGANSRASRPRRRGSARAPAKPRLVPRSRRSSRCHLQPPITCRPTSSSRAPRCWPSSVQGPRNLRRRK